MLTDRRDNFISEEVIKRLLDKCGDIISPKRVIILSQNKSLNENLWAKFGFSAISVTNFCYLNMTLDDWASLYFGDCFNYESAFERFLYQYPEMENLLKLNH